MPNPVPNFFVIGAPKCGTTALTEYLRLHPRIFLSRPKEPRFWCNDLEINPQAIRWAVTTESIEQYLQLFKTANQEHLAIGEGSTLYLYSKVAVQRILEFNPAAKFIVMVRNPVDLFHSWHSYLVRQFREDAESPQRAWELQAERLEGRSLPRQCDIPEKLQYRSIISLGEQIKRLLEIVPREQVHIIVLEDFSAETAQVYAQTLNFLGVPHDGRTEFPKVNEAFSYRFPWLARRLLSPSHRLLSGLHWLKSRLPAPLMLRLRYHSIVMLRKNTKKLTLSEELRKTIAEELREDIELLSQLLDRDLNHWLPAEMSTKCHAN